VQNSLQNVIDVMEALTDEVYIKAREKGIDCKKVEEMIDQRKIYEWNVENVEAILSN